MARSTPAEAELSQRIRWLIHLRWIASSAVLYGTFVSTVVLGLNVDPIPLYVIGGAMAVYNSLFLIVLKLSEAAPGDHRRACRRIAYSQVLVDLFFLTLLIHFSGGVENPFAFYFVFHIVIASILLSRLDTFLLATAAVVMFGGLALAESTGLLQHQQVFESIRTDPSRGLLLTGAAWLVFASTLYLVAYMATSIVGRLRERDLSILVLNTELEARARELEAAYKRVVQLEQTKSQYMRKVSHEIRAPMAAIRTTLQVVLEGFAGEVPSDQKEMIGRAERRTAALLALVGDLLVLSRARESGPLTQRKPVDLAQIVERVAELQRPRADAKEIALSVSHDAAPATLLADPEAMEELVTNLVANAIKYTPNHGRVDLRVGSASGIVSLQVSDTGIGISPEERSRIFDDFYRSPAARRFCEEGTGLGLSIVHSIVEAHGGQIELDSKPGAGTTFTVTLPADPPAHERAEREVEEVEEARTAAAVGGSSGTAPTTAPLEHSSAGVNSVPKQTPGSHRVDQGGIPMISGEVAHQRIQARAVVADAVSLSSLLALLQEYGPVYGPTRKGEAYSFSSISTVDDLALEYHTTILPPKKLLLRPMETLFHVRLQDGFSVQQEAPAGNQVLFGVHSCDLSAIKLLDKVYRQTYADPIYSARRDSTLIVALTCTAPRYDKCFCSSMNTGPSPTDGYDLLLTQLGDALLLEAGSTKGEAVVAGLRWSNAPADALARKAELVKGAVAAMPRAIDTTNLPGLMNANYEHPYWMKLKEKCLACGNCALSCPSCYCYNVIDRVGLDTTAVQRTRTWDVCLLPEFAEVHGGNFRKERDARIKQFMYHKLSYWVDQYGAFGCVGCGRCINGCPAGIDITEAAGEIRGEAQ